MSESIIIALIGIAGAVVGSVATMAGNFLVHCLREKSEFKKDDQARSLLKEMLEHNQFIWRNIDTLMHVIGADEDRTKRLLLQIGTRASEDGQPMWALKSRAPLNKGSQSA